MKNTKRFSFLIGLAVLGTALGLVHSAHASAPLSNELPVPLVRQIMDQGYWESAFDNDGDASARDLRWFWSQINSGRENAATVVDQLFGTHEGDSSAIRLPRLYPVKILMLRFALKDGASPARAAQISQGWKSRYLEIALSTIEIASIPDYRPILDSFRDQLRNGSLTVADLSPEERTRLKSEIAERHGADITAIDRSTGHYQVTGLFNSDQKYFALDFARPVEETIITFAHEMVHAADPELVKHRRDFSSLTDPVVTMIARWLGTDQNAREIALDLVDHVFFETGLDGSVEIADEIRAQRMKKLSDALAQPGSPKPTEQELATLGRWMDAAIGLTIGNEYRAYGLSIVLYSVLKSRYQILPPSRERQEFVERFLSGDKIVATNLAITMNPFLKARSDIYRKYLQTSQRQGQTLDPATQALYLRIGNTLDRLELSYLEETEKFLRSLNDRIGSMIRSIPRDGSSTPSPLPEWAQPGGFDLPSNPFNVLTARITTAWVLRFRQNLDLFVDDLKMLNEPLLGMRSGILDLHDLSRGERKLIGISYDNSPWASDPDKLDSKLRQDIDAIPVDITQYFAVVNWSPESALSPNGDAIDGKTVAQNLVKLRVLKSAAWLDNAFPPVKNTLLGVKSFLQRLREGLFNADEISPERSKELQNELIQVWDRAGVSQQELLRLRILLKELSDLHAAAEDSKWAGVATSFMDKSNFVLLTMENLGIQNTTVDSVTAENDAIRAAFSAQMKPYADTCRKRSSKDAYGLGGFWPERGPFALGEKTFPLTIVCYAGKLYLVRQPGDYIDFMTTLIKNGAPEARVFMGARPVRLYPAEFPGAKK